SMTRVSEDTVGLPTPKTVETGAGPVAQHGSRRDGRRRPSSRRRSRRSDVRLLNGRYELDRTLGAGVMGTVFRAVDHRLGRPVAVKMLHEGRRGTEGFRRRLAA